VEEEEGEGLEEAVIGLAPFRSPECTPPLPQAT
jgi:hypothetical protein